MVTFFSPVIAIISTTGSSRSFIVRLSRSSTSERVALGKSLRPIDKRRRLVLLFDAAGLGLFAVAGTQKALIAGLNPVMAIFMGVLTGIGGGILRDVLVNQTPTVLEADIYAVAALAAGVVVVIGYELHYPAFVVLTVGALLCFWLRVMAIYRGWHLPVAQSQNRRD